VADKPQFQLHMRGAGLAPDTVRASDLAALLVELEGAIVETAKGQEIPLAYDSEQVLVSLVNVEHGNSVDLIEHGNSEDLTLAVATPISSAVSTMTQAIVSRDFESLPVPAQKHLYELSEHAVKQRWSLEFHESNGLLVLPAIISYEFQVPKPLPVDTTMGTTTLWGHLIKAGGDSDPRALIRLRNGKLFSVRVSRRMVEEIQEQKLIYKDIGFRGVAEWRLDDWSIVSFKTDSIAEYRPHETTLTKSFQALAEASGGRWESVDPVAYVDDLRSEGE
jgi:hypothetical protein